LVIIFLGANLIFDSLISVLTTVLNTLGYRIWFVILINLTSWLGIGLAILLSCIRGFKAEYWMEGTLAGQIIVSIISFIVLYKVVTKQGKNLKLIIKTH